MQPHKQHKLIRLGLATLPETNSAKPNRDDSDIFCHIADFNSSKGRGVHILEPEKFPRMDCVVAKLKGTDVDVALPCLAGSAEKSETKPGDCRTPHLAPQASNKR